MRPTYEDVVKVLCYDANSGTLTWRARPGCSRTDRAGKPAGNIRKDGYLQLQIFGKKYLAHRVCWLLATGEWPVEQVDHKNRARTDNRFDNLRAVPQTNNQHNRGRSAANTSGVTGVARHTCGRFEAYIYVEKTRHYLGLHDTVPEAAKARAEAERRMNPRGPM